MFYEMVTERKAFDRDDVESLRQSILESTPVAPLHVSPKVHPLLSTLIIKSLAKDPAERYQSGREMLEDLEKCKESKPAATAKKPEAAKGTSVPAQVKTAAQTKFVGASAPKPAATGVARPAATTTAQPKASAAKATANSMPDIQLSAKPSKLATPKAHAAAAGAGFGQASGSIPGGAAPAEMQELDLSDQFVAPQGESEQPSAYMSAAVAEAPEVETFEPQTADTGSKIAIDPMMAEGGAATSKSTSFSEISELPPLKEVYVAPPPPPPVETAPVQAASPAITPFRGGRAADEKPKVQPREVARKAIKEVKGVPPKLYLYALGGAAILILIIGIGVTYYIHSLGEDDAGKPRETAASQSSAQPELAVPAPKEVTPAPAQPVEVQEPEAPVEQASAPTKTRAPRKKAGNAAAVIIPGQLVIDSTPQGAQVQVDGATDPSWVTPFTLTNLQPGQHSITTSKSGFSTDSRTINVSSGNRATAQIHLTQLMATLLVKSDPAGASVYVDGHDTNTKTPAQVGIDKGQHVVLVRLSGYLDETMNGQFALGQTYNFNPSLRQLGNVDSIKTVGGKMSRLFGGKGQAGQATVTIHTQPKGAQVAVNQHMLDKTSPVDVAVDPGNYVIDITLSGYAPIHKIITASKSGKVVIDEVLQTQ